MTERQTTLEELKGRQWEQVLRDVADQQERGAVLLPGGLSR